MASILERVNTDRAYATLLRTVEVLGKDSFEPVWQELLAAAVELVPGAQAGSLWVRDAENKGYCMVAQQGYDDRLLGTWMGPEILTYWFGEPELWQKGLPRIGDRAFIARAMQQNRGHISAEEFELFETAGRTGEIACTLCQPVVMNGQILAYFDLDNFSDERALGQAAIETAQSFALQVAALLAAQRSRAQREQAYEGSLRAIGVALEARDLETAGHTDRVAALALQVGGQLGLGATGLRHLRWGAYLHDIGKLAVPDSILLKPGSLTREEFEVIQTHCLNGYRFSQNLPFLPEQARQVILYHHERWSGHGYPNGLHGEAIPLLARIFSVCDVFDALVCKRPYKPAWRLGEAVAEIANQAGEQFDPQVVAAFLRVIRQSYPLLESEPEQEPVLLRAEG
jgi:HD-GYP domain-containing protein (c-di-GMP phosphodiesterase class II)